METGIHKYKAFCKVADNGSFTQAAAELGYSQSSISRMVADLEQGWGLTLALRSRAGVTLTPEGEALLPYVRRLCAELDDIESRVDDLKDNATGVLRIGTISSIATHWLPEVISSFKEKYPQMTYELLLGSYSEIEDWILSGRVDCGFIRLPAKEGLEAVPLTEDELMAVLPREHVLAGCERVQVQEFCKYPFLSLAENRDVEDAGIFNSLGLRPEVLIETWDDYCIMSMVEKGMGISILPSLILKRIPHDVIVRPLEPKASRTLAFAVRDGGYTQLSVQRFMEHLGAIDCGLNTEGPLKRG